MKEAFFKFIMNVLKFGIGAYLVLAVILAFNQSTLLFFPSHNPNKNESWIVGKDYYGVKFIAKDPRHIFLMMHGNGGQADNRGYFFKVLPQDSSLYVFEYPGYGQRKGAITQGSINAAALKAYDSLKSEFPNIPTTIVGESVGTGAASYVASQRAAKDLVLVTPYHDLPSLAQEKISLFPTYWLCAYRWNIAELLKDFKGRITIIGASNDEVIPLHHAKKLAHDLPSARFEIVNGGHNSYDMDAMKNILQEACINLSTSQARP
jgi:pimeloyl-ACP methyl ester carboxylesterase